MSNLFRLHIRTLKNFQHKIYATLGIDKPNPSPDPPCALAQAPPRCAATPASTGRARCARDTPAAASATRASPSTAPPTHPPPPPPPTPPRPPPRAAWRLRRGPSARRECGRRGTSRATTTSTRPAPPPAPAARRRSTSAAAGCRQSAPSPSLSLPPSTHPARSLPDPARAIPQARTPTSFPQDCSG